MRCPSAILPLVALALAIIVPTDARAGNRRVAAAVVRVVVRGENTHELQVGGHRGKARRRVRGVYEDGCSVRLVFNEPAKVVRKKRNGGNAERRPHKGTMRKVAEGAEARRFVNTGAVPPPPAANSRNLGPYPPTHDGCDNHTFLRRPGASSSEVLPHLYPL